MAKIETETVRADDLKQVIDYAGDMAGVHGLNPHQTQMLKNFANVNYRILDIETDFTTKDYDWITYPVFVNEDKKIIGLRLYRGTTAYTLDVFRQTAFKLYESSLRDSDATKAAAQDVVDFVKLIFSKPV